MGKKLLDEVEGDGMERRSWGGEFVEKKGEGEKGNFRMKRG